MNEEIQRQAKFKCQDLFTFLRERVRASQLKVKVDSHVSTVLLLYLDKCAPKSREDI